MNRKKVIIEWPLSIRQSKKSHFYADTQTQPLNSWDNIYWFIWKYPAFVKTPCIRKHNLIVFFQPQFDCCINICMPSTPAKKMIPQLSLSDITHPLLNLYSLFTLHRRLVSLLVSHLYWAQKVWHVVCSRLRALSSWYGDSKKANAPPKS